MRSLSQRLTVHLSNLYGLPLCGRGLGIVSLHYDDVRCWRCKLRALGDFLVRCVRKAPAKSSSSPAKGAYYA